MHVVTDSGARLDLRGAASLGQGVSGTVYSHPLDASLCLKIYHPGDAAASSTKVRAMLANVPEGIRDRIGRQQAAWPIEAVHQAGRPVGFTMPKVDIRSTRSLTALCNDAETDDVARKQLLVAAINICSLVANMHRAGHCLIDFNPENFRFHGHSGFLTLVDCDGFQIADPLGGRIDAPAAWLDHLAPRFIERDGNPKLREANAGGLYQDSWGCSLLAFRLLNRNILPFDGIPKRGMAGRVPAENAERIRACASLYPYGQSSSSILNPLPLSLHKGMPSPLRNAFDQCFSREDPIDAIEWRALLSDLLSRGSTCRTNTRHFALSAPCEQCSSQLPAALTPSSAAMPTPGVVATGPQPIPPIGPRVGPAVPARDMRVWLWLIGLAFVGVLLLWMRSIGNPAPETVAISGPAKFWTAAIVWEPTDAGQEAIKGCRDRSCLYEMLAKHGAPLESIEFMKAEQQALSDEENAYPVAFNGTGQVKVVELFYPNLGQAGSSDFVFVNGSSGMIQTGRSPAMEQATSESSQYQALKARYPEASWWDSPSYVKEDLSGDGSQLFRFRMVILNGCRACAVLGLLEIGYFFGPDGRYMGMSILGAEPDPEADYGWTTDRLAQESQYFQDMVQMKADGERLSANVQTLLSDKGDCRLSLNANPMSGDAGWMMTDDVFNVGDVDLQRNLAPTISGNMSISCKNGEVCISRENLDGTSRPTSRSISFMAPPGNVETLIQRFRELQRMCPVKRSPS